MDKDTILDYVTETPGNTNRAVLGSMLDEIGGGGAEPLIINRTFDSDTESYTYGDTTFGEVRQAFESGRLVIIRTEGDTTTNFDLVYGIDYNIASGNCSGGVRWYNGSAGVYGNYSTATLEELDVIILDTSLE